MNPFSKISNVEPPTGGTGSYVLPGEADFEVKAVKLIDSQQSEGFFFIVELETITSTNPDQAPQCSWAVRLPGKNDIGLRNSRAFIAALLDIEFSQVDEKTANAVTTPEAHADYVAGRKLHASASNITTKSGNPFTKVVWSKFKGSEGLPF